MAQSKKRSSRAISTDEIRTIGASEHVRRRLSQLDPSFEIDLTGAKEAAEEEHQRSVRDSLKLYRKAVIFSLVLSLAVVMEGYDLTLYGTFFGYTQFKNAFGTERDKNGNLIIPAHWQSAISNGVQVGSIVGLGLNGWIGERIGYRKTMMVSLIMMVSFIFITFFARNIQTLVIAAVLQGVPWGVFQTLSVTYASEVMPTSLRAYLTTYVNLCWVLGQLIASGVTRGCSTIPNEWAYRIPFAVQWIWPIPIMVGTILMPESPWWLIRKGKFEHARRSLTRLTSPSTDIPFNIEGYLMMMYKTNELEKAMASGTHYWDCFRGIDLRRTEIASIAWIAQAFCGSTLMGYSVQFYQVAGMDESNALNMSIGQYSMGFLGTIGSWFLMLYVGRRALYLYGLLFLLTVLLIVGGLAIVPSNVTGAQWGIGSMLLFYTLVYDLTLGPVCYSLVSEIPSTRLKIKTVVIARSLYNVAGIINNFLMPEMLSPNGWNWGAKSGFFFAGLCLLLAIWTYFRLPEPMNRTYGELDILFENRISARKFHKTPVDQFHEGHENAVGVKVDHDVTPAKQMFDHNESTYIE